MRYAGTVARGLMRRLVLLVVACAEGHALAGTATPIPELSAIPLPDAVVVRRIFDDATVDGHPLALVQIHTELGCETLLAGTQALWRTRLSPHLLAGQRGPWQVLSAAFPDGFINLQVQARRGGACEALLSRWPRVIPASVPGPAGVRSVLPDWPASVRVLRHTAERRPGATASVTTAQSALPVSRLMTIFRAQAESQGFRIEATPPGAALPPNRTVIAARKPGAELTIFLNASGDVTDVVLIHDQRSP